MLELKKIENGFYEICNVESVQKMIIGESDLHDLVEQMNHQYYKEDVLTYLECEGYDEETFNNPELLNNIIESYINNREDEQYAGYDELLECALQDNGYYEYIETLEQREDELDEAKDI